MTNLACVAKLVDAYDLKSYPIGCRFKSSHEQIFKLSLTPIQLYLFKWFQKKKIFKNLINYYKKQVLENNSYNLKVNDNNLTLLYITNPKRQQIYNFFFFKFLMHKSFSTGFLLALKQLKIKFLKKENKSFYTILTTFWYYFPELFDEKLVLCFKNFTFMQYQFLKLMFLHLNCNFHTIIFKKSYNKLQKIKKRLKKRTYKSLIKYDWLRLNFNVLVYLSKFLSIWVIR